MSCMIKPTFSKYLQRFCTLMQIFCRVQEFFCNFLQNLEQRCKLCVRFLAYTKHSYQLLVSTYKTVKLSQYVFRPVVRRVAGDGKVTTSFGRNRLKYKVGLRYLLYKISGPPQILEAYGKAPTYLK